MNPSSTLAATLAVTLCLTFAGCSGPDDDGAAVQLSASTYAIAVSGMAATPLLPGANFTFTSTITGSLVHTSDHIGAHFGANSTGTPSTTVYTTTCAHQGGSLPGTFQVSCRAPTLPGTYYIRGHARIIENNQTWQWWSAETTFRVA